MIPRPFPVRVTYLTELLLSPVGNGDEWVHRGEFIARIETVNGEDSVTITIPVGTTTDLGSIPRLPVVFLAFEGKARRAAVLHDRLYELQMPRAWADMVFYAALEHEVNDVDQYLMWAAVRLGGASYYADSIPQPLPTTERQAP